MVDYLNPFHRACALLAAAGFSENELESIRLEIAQSGPFGFLDTVHAMRVSLEKAGQQSEHVESVQPSRPEKDDSSELTHRIQRLLIDEAGLSKRDAAAALSNALRSRRPSLEVPLFVSKDGFSSWIGKLLDVVPPSELFHVATMLRNGFAHGVLDDWLRKK